MSTETLEIKKSNAIAAFREADTQVKKVLTKLFGEKALSEKITDRVKSLLDAYEIEQPSKELSDLIGYTGQDPDMISASAYAKLTHIVKVLNEGWKPNWSNENEYKYFPYFKHKSGFGLSYDVYWFAHSDVGSRLCFKSAELAEYAGKQFADIYNDYLTIKA